VSFAVVGDARTFLTSGDRKVLRALALEMWSARGEPAVTLARAQAAELLDTQQDRLSSLERYHRAGVLSETGDGRVVFADRRLLNSLVMPIFIERLGSDYAARGLMRDRAAEALIRTGVSAIPALLRALRQDDVALGNGAAYVLRRIGAPSARPVAWELTNGDVDTRRRAVAALDSLEAAALALPELLQAVYDDDLMVRMGAVRRCGPAEMKAHCLDFGKRLPTLSR